LIFPYIHHSRFDIFSLEKVPNGILLHDPNNLLEGTGKRFGHVKIKNIIESKSPHIRQLIKKIIAERKKVAMKLTIITGASSGIGEAVAHRLGTDGHRVVLVARTRSKLEEVANEIGENALIEACDASDGNAVIAIAERVLRDHGVPEVIVNSAGAGEWKFIEDTPPEEAVTMMKAPYFAAFNITHAFMRNMIEQRKGVIIHVGSPVSIFTWPSCTGYAAARWALRGLHESLCDDLRGTGVRSCHVVFGKVSSPYFAHNPNTEEKLPGIAKTVPTISTEECAKVIARASQRPRRRIVHPFMLRMYCWSYAVFPWFTRWLLRSTGTKRQI